MIEPTMIQQADYLVRLIAIGAALLLLAQTVAGGLPIRLKGPLVVMVLGAVAAVMGALPQALRPGAYLALLDLVALALPFAIWWLGRALLAAPPPRAAALALGGLAIAGWAVGHFVTGAGPAAFAALNLVALGLSVDLARAALGHRPRTSERAASALWLAAPGAALAVQGGLAAIPFGAGEGFAAIRLAGALIVLVLLLICGLAFCRSDPALLDHPDDDNPAAP